MINKANVFLSAASMVAVAFALMMMAPIPAAAEQPTEVKPIAVAVDKDLSLCGQPFANVTAYTDGELKKNITFWSDPKSGEQLPIYPGSENPHAILIGDGSGVMALDIEPIGAVAMEIELQSFAQSKACPFAYRDCGSGRCVAHIFQRCCTGGSGWAVCGFLSPYPFCGVRGGQSTCCNLFGQCLHDLFVSSQTVEEMAIDLIDEINAGNVLAGNLQCDAE